MPPCRMPLEIRRHRFYEESIIFSTSIDNSNQRDSEHFPSKCSGVRSTAVWSHRNAIDSVASRTARDLFEPCSLLHLAPSDARQFNISSSRTLSEPQSVLAMKSCPGGTGSRQMADGWCYLCNPGSISASIPIDRAPEPNLHVRLLSRLEVRVSGLDSEFSIHMFEPTPTEITQDSI